MTRGAAVWIVAIACAGCGDNAWPDEPFAPLREGSTWRYQSSPGTSVLIDTVARLEDVGGPSEGTEAYRIESYVSSGGPETHYRTVWASVVDGRLALHHEILRVTAWEVYYLPEKLLLDPTLRPGQSGQGQYTAITETGTLDVPTWWRRANDADVDVPAGMFQSLVFEVGDSFDERTVWYAPGIGKVREQIVTEGEPDRVLELIEYTR